MSLISIIMPIYNSSKTISESINSLQEQTLSDIEIICIDDSSSDDSTTIVKTYMKNDSRIKLIEHHTNMGTLKTRYDGVMAATGKYVMFIDADDLYKENACEKAYAEITNRNADMLQFGTEVVSERLDEDTVYPFRHFLIPLGRPVYNEEILRMQFNGIAWHVWNRIYDAELCKKAYEDAGEEYHIYSDDLYVSFFLSFYSVHFESILDELYVYRLDNGMSNSISNLKLLKTVCENSKFIYKCMDFLKKEGHHEMIEYYCFNTPLLEIKHSFDVWDKITDKKEQREGLAILKKTWDNETFGDCYRSELKVRFDSKFSLFEKIVLYFYK